MNLAAEIAKSIASITGLSKEEVLEKIEIPKDPSLGHLAFPCFTLSKKLFKSPNAIAENLAKTISFPNLVLRIEANGPYLNFFLNVKKIGVDTINSILKNPDSFGRGRESFGICIEYLAPNTNKPLHLGHLRNIFIGSSVSQILRFCGNNVHEVNLINDRGIHICKSMIAYMKWGKNKEPDKKSDHFVGDFYVMFSKKAAEQPELEDEAQACLQKWEEGDIKTIALWKKMNKWAIRGFDETLKKLGISFEKVYYESEIYTSGKDTIIEAEKKGIFKTDETGAVVAELSSFGLPDKVLLRSDGTSIYMTQDIALANKKFLDFDIDKSLYVVGNEQNLHFQQLFAILKMLKNDIVKNCTHINYGLVNLPEGRMKSREGTVVDADDILAEMEKLAHAEIRKRHKDISEEEARDRAIVIGHGALKFFILKNDSYKDIVYNPNESISFEGETGPYVQYAHARICSILSKAGDMGIASRNFHIRDSSVTALTDEEPIMLELSRFPFAVEKAANSYKPNIIAQYLLGLSRLFNEYYAKVPILSTEPGLREERLALISAIQEVLATGLKLLGIKAPEVM